MLVAWSSFIAGGAVALIGSVLLCALAIGVLLHTHEDDLGE